MPWLSEAAQTQARISAAAPEDSLPAENSDDDIDIGASDGSTGETELLTTALSAFSLHTDKAANRTSSIPDIEKKRINDAMSRTDVSHSTINYWAPTSTSKKVFSLPPPCNDNPVPHSILITVKASVALATGQAANGKMAKTNRADPNSRGFMKFLEGVLLTAAGSGAGATFLFKRIKQHGKKGDEFVSTSFRLAFGEKVFCDRILKSKLAAHGAGIKKVQEGLHHHHEL